MNRDMWHRELHFHRRRCYSISSLVPSSPRAASSCVWMSTLVHSSSLSSHKSRSDSCPKPEAPTQIGFTFHSTSRNEASMSRSQERTITKWPSQATTYSPLLAETLVGFTTSMQPPGVHDILLSVKVLMSKASGARKAKKLTSPESTCSGHKKVL
jgi:hypothetical protein